MTKTTIQLMLGLLVISTSALASPEIPGADQKQPIALVGGTIHPVSSPPIENGVLVFDSGKITMVGIGKKADIPRDAKKIDVSGKHVYPGLFDASTNLGLVEINAVRATRDSSEVGRFNPNVQAHVAVNPDSELIPVTRSNGVLLALTAPTGGIISGRCSVLQLDGWTYEDLALKPDVGLVVHWPRMTPVVTWWEEKTTDQQRKDRDETIKQLHEFFENARAYRKAKAAENNEQRFDAKLEAMLPVLEGQLPLVVVADEVQQIQSAVSFATQQDAKLIILGGYDAIECAELLKKHNVPIIIGGVYRLPRRRSDDYDAPFTLAERLRKANIQFCISGSGRFGASNVRNLPYHAAMAASVGLPQDEALKAITLYPAQILGVANRVGSLEVGKDATLFISSGDPLDTPTQIEAAYIQGRAVDLSDRHKRLWKKYQEKYRRSDAK